MGICDDKNDDRKKLLEYAGAFAAAHPEHPLKAETFASPYDLLQAAGDRGGFDLYLLDIIMPHLNGIGLAARIRERGEPAEILFLTTSREYAVEAFGVKASGYLLKPVQQADFDREVLGCIRNLAPGENPALLLKTRYGLRRVPIRELVMVESFNHRRVCTLADGTTVETPATLSSLYEQLRQYPCFFPPPPGIYHQYGLCKRAHPRRAAHGRRAEGPHFPQCLFQIERGLHEIYVLTARRTKRTSPA